MHFFILIAPSKVSVAKRKLFRPYPNQNPSDRMKDQQNSRQQLFDELGHILPNGCFTSFFEKDELDTGEASTSEPTSGAPLENLIIKLSKTCTTTEQFLSKIPVLSEEDIEQIERETVGQAENSVWVYQRKGRMTASNFYSVYTRVNTIKCNASTINEPNVEPLIKKLMGYQRNNPDLPALKHGRSFEPVARERYLSLVRCRHNDFKFRECGLFVHPDKPYLGASPDLLVECVCCGPGVVEIKCPFSITHESPSAENLNYICTKEGATMPTLKQNHAYFAQIQGQMALTRRKYCDFFVYTHKGYFMQRIYFDNNHWCELLLNLEYFFRNYLAEELVHGNVGRKLDVLFLEH